MANSLTRTAAFAAVAALVSSGASISLSAQQAARGPIVRDLSRDIACSPHAAVLPPAPSLRVLGGQQPKRTVFGAADLVIVSGGSAQGVRVGQEYFVRRVIHDEFALPVSGFVPVSIHTAGWVRIVEVDTDMAVATIADSCDGVLEGDYLEPYVRPVVPVAAAPGEPDFAASGAIVLGDERRQIGAAGTTMVLDRGLAHGVRPGQRGTIFRNALDGAGPIVRIGEATALLVRQDTSVIRIDSSRDAVMVGDRVALHK
jgi:hypothetical protein